MMTKKEEKKENDTESTYEIETKIFSLKCVSFKSS